MLCMTRPPETMEPALTTESTAMPIRRPSWAKTNLAGGCCVTLGADGPPLIVKVELGDHRDQVHIGFVIRVERADVAPVADLFGVDVVEIVGDHAATAEQPGDHVVAEIVAGVADPRRPRGGRPAGLGF